MIGRTGPAPRRGYTLVELLVVIAIIAVLVSLTTAAVQQVRVAAKRTSTATEISQLDEALTQFKTKHGFYPPSHVVITNQSGVSEVRRFKIPVMVDPAGAQAPTDDLRQQYASYQVLQRLYPRWDPSANGTWSPVGMITPPLESAGKTLDPAQVMPYFLAGPGVITGNPAGWSMAGPKTPATGATSVFGPYGEFANNLSRLKNPNNANNYDGFMDTFGRPYVYFLSNAGKTYEPSLVYPWTTDPAPALDPTTPNPTTPTAAASKVAGSVYPVYTVSGTKILYQNPDKFQILSAGYDKKFGPGWFWDPIGYARDGKDDLANFNSGIQLGAAGAN